MSHLFAPTIFIIVVCSLPAVCQTTIDSLPTAVQIPDSAAAIPVDSDSNPTLLQTSTPAPAAPEQNQTKVSDSVKSSGIPVDFVATLENPQATAPAKQPAPSVADRSSSTPMVLIEPDAVCDFTLGNNYRLPEDKVFLLGGKDLFVVSARPSKNISIGMSGGSASRSSLHIPYGFINDAQSAAEDSSETARGIYAFSGDFCYNEDGSIPDAVPFDEEYLPDKGYFWMESTNEIDFVGIKLSALKMYLNAHVPLGIFSVMIKPLAFGQHLVTKSTLFRSEFDPVQNQMLFAGAEEITTDFAVRNFGINADLAFTLQINKALSIYARCPVEYRNITTAAIRSIFARFSYYPEKQGDYTRYVKLDTLSVAAYRGNSYFFSPRLGVRLDAKKDLTWPLVFIPFIAQHASLEGYFRRARYLWQNTHEFNPEFGSSYISFQNIRFGNRFFTGMENMSRLNFNCTYTTFNKEYHAYMVTEYTPRLIVKEHFSVSGFRIGTEHYRPFNYNVLNIDFQQIGFGYFNDTWGLSCQAGFDNAGEAQRNPAVFNVMMWRSWK